MIEAPPNAPVSLMPLEQEVALEMAVLTLFAENEDGGFHQKFVDLRWTIWPLARAYCGVVPGSVVSVACVVDQNYLAQTWFLVTLWIELGTTLAPIRKGTMEWTYCRRRLEKFPNSIGNDLKLKASIWVSLICQSLPGAKS
jgi:hypothetical protein